MSQINHCPDPSLCKAGDACGGWCSPGTAINPPCRYAEYLTKLCDLGYINMLDARPYLIQKFGLSAVKAGSVLRDWMASSNPATT